MLCPKCSFDQPDENAECPRCGIVFSKYVGHEEIHPGKVDSQKRSSQTDPVEEKPPLDIPHLLKEILLYIKPDINPLYWGGRLLVFALLFAWGLKFIFTPLEINYTGKSFMHMINLPFHEAGHIIFRPFGDFMSTLGGSLGQLLIPLICILTFLLKSRDTFAASVGVWWLGESFMDLAPYINDARLLRLILLGGVTGRDAPGYHDWEYILGTLGLLRYDHAIASAAYAIGIFCMLLFFSWGGYLLYKQYKNLDRS